MLTNAVVLLVIIGTLYATDRRSPGSRSVWPATYIALLLVVAALFGWDLLPSSDRIAKNAVVIAMFAAVMLLIVNLVLARRSRDLSG